MPEFLDWLRTLIFNYPSLKYLAVFLGSAFGGEIAVITLAFLAAQKIFSPIMFLSVSFAGVWSGDALWFYLGKTPIVRKIISHKYTAAAITRILEALDKLSRGSHVLAFILAKFVVGTRAVIIFYISRTGLSFGYFVRQNLLAIVVWLVTVASIGYLSGLGYAYFSNILENIYAAVGAALLVLIFFFIVEAWVNRRFTQAEAQVEEDEDMLK